MFTRLSAMAKRANLWVVAGVFTFFASGFIVNLGGIGTSIGLAGHWVEGLAPDSSGLPWFYYPRTLGIYEFLTIALATVGAVRGLCQRSTLDAFLITWALFALLLGMLLGHREPVWMVDALLPLLLLAARGFEQVWDRLAGGMTWSDVARLCLGQSCWCRGL